MNTRTAVLLCCFAVIPAFVAAEDKVPAAEANGDINIVHHDVAGVQPGAVKALNDVAPGYRGLTLPMAGVQLLNVKKGDSVDVLVTFNAIMTDDRKEMVTATILQNVLVLEINRPEKVADTGAIQLMLNPNEAQYAALSTAQAQSLTLSRRTPGDREMHPMEMASFRRLFTAGDDKEKDKAPKAEAKQQKKVAKHGAASTNKAVAVDETAKKK